MPVACQLASYLATAILHLAGVKDVCDLQAMLNPFHMDNVVATSESELENELVSISGQVPSELTAQIPRVVVENSSDIHIGPHLQYNGPVTVKQYITVRGKDNVSSSVDTLDDTDVSANLQPVGAVPKYNSKDKFTFQKHAWLRRRCVLSLLAVVLIVASVIAIIFALSKGDSYSIPFSVGNLTNTIHFQYENAVVDVYEGHKYLQWFVKVTALSPVTLTWYGPNCQPIGNNTGPARHQLYISQDGKVTRLKLYDIRVTDRGLYKLQARSEEEEQWAYFTLNVKGKNPLDRQHVVVCYVAEWAHRRGGLGKFTVDNIDPTLCTHLVYAFANLNTTSNSIVSWMPEYDLGVNNWTGAYRNMTSLKNAYPHLKVLLSMGGWAERMEKNYTEVASSPDRRKVFVNSVSEFLRKYNFDGFDLHWQYPGQATGGKPEDKKYFVDLLKDLREEFNKFGWLLTVPLGVLPDTLEHSYDIPSVSQLVDYMFAFCYAYHGSWETQTGPNAPLYPLFPDDDRNVESSISNLIFMKADPNKLVLGIPLYGRIFKLKDTNGTIGFQKPSAGEGAQGPYVQEPGFWGYNEICMAVYNPLLNWQIYWDNVTHTPYASKDDQFISYDDVQSITEKVDLALRNKLAGVSVWSLDTDDFRGSCTYGRSGSAVYPLMQAINNALDRSVSWKKVPCNIRSPVKPLD